MDANHQESKIVIALVPHYSNGVKCFDELDKRFKLYLLHN